MSIQNICIIILGGISLLALFDLRKKTKELDGLKCKFEREPSSNNEQPTDDNKTVILQLNRLKKQLTFLNVALCIAILLLLFLCTLSCKTYMNTNDLKDFTGIIISLF